MDTWADGRTREPARFAGNLVVHAIASRMGVKPERLKGTSFRIGGWLVLARTSSPGHLEGRQVVWTQFGHAAIKALVNDARARGLEPFVLLIGVGDAPVLVDYWLIPAARVMDLLNDLGSGDWHLRVLQVEGGWSLEGGTKSHRQSLDIAPHHHRLDLMPADAQRLAAMLAQKPQELETKPLSASESSPPDRASDETAATANPPAIVRRANVLHGEPVLRGTRTPVRAIVELHRQGLAPEELVERLPHLELGQVYHALAYAFDHAEEIERLIEMNRIDEAALTALAGR